MILFVKTIVTVLIAAAALTYCSLAVPDSVIAVCGNVGIPSYCSVLAFGFPLPFVVDSQAVSPVGSVARDPLSLLVGLDDVLWLRLGFTFLFWMLIVVLSRMVWLHSRPKHDS